MICSFPIMFDTYHFHYCDSEKLDLIISKLNTMALNQEQLAAELRALKEQNDKATAEQLAKLASLEEALANAGNTTEAVDTALADLKASIQRDDDLNADATEGSEGENS